MLLARVPVLQYLGLVQVLWTGVQGRRGGNLRAKVADSLSVVSHLWLELARN